MLGRIARVAAVAIVLLVGLGVFVWCTRAGLGISPDSINYLHAAKSVAAGHGLTMLSHEGGPVPMTHFPPLFPLALSVSHLMNVPVVDFARFANAVLMVFNAGLLMGLVYRYSRSFWAAVLSGGWYVALWPVVSLHLMLWTEPLFIGITLLFISSLSKYLGGGSLRYAALAGLLASVAFLTRYVGVSGIAAGGLVCLLAVAKDTRRGLKGLAAFSISAISMPCIWIIRNVYVGGG